MFYAKICPSQNPCPMGRTLVRNVAIPDWGFLILMEAQGFHYHRPIYIYIYIYIYLLSYMTLTRASTQLHCAPALRHQRPTVSRSPVTFLPTPPRQFRPGRRSRHASAHPRPLLRPSPETLAPQSPTAWFCSHHAPTIPSGG
jgi:hypothetical protein